MNYDLKLLMISLSVLIPLVLIQGTWIFIDARKRKEKYYWLWGILGLLNTPTSIIVYLLVTRWRNIKCKNCGRGISEKWDYCPYCSKRIKEE